MGGKEAYNGNLYQFLCNIRTASGTMGIHRSYIMKAEYTTDYPEGYIFWTRAKNKMGTHIYFHVKKFNKLIFL